MKYNLILEHIYKKEFLNTEQRSNYERLTDAQLDIINKYYENIKAKYKEPSASC